MKEHQLAEIDQLAEDIASPDYRHMVEVIMPRILRRFIMKSADYGDAYRLLGVKGQFSDINRKFWKLYESVWHDRTLIGEQPSECAEDIIGHCLLMIFLMEEKGQSAAGENRAERAESTSDPGPVPPTLAPSEAVDSSEVEGRCPGAVDRPEGLRRCELYLGHRGPHLTEVGTIHQYQWEDAA